MLKKRIINMSLKYMTVEEELILKILEKFLTVIINQILRKIKMEGG